MTGSPWTSWQALNLFAGTAAQLNAQFPAPNIWVGFRVFTSDMGWCMWIPNEGWVTIWSWLGRTQ